MNEPVFPFLSNPVFKGFLQFVGFMFAIYLMTNIDMIRSDVSYIRKELQFEEEPIEPFSVLFVHVFSTSEGKELEAHQDTIQLVCDPNDTLKIMNLLQSATFEDCGLGHCDKDSVEKVEVELILD